MPNRGESKHGREIEHAKQRNEVGSSLAPGLRKPQGRYANFFQIGQNAAEFLLEFGQEEGRIIHTRIYISPQHAQILSDLLADTLKRHAERF